MNNFEYNSINTIKSNVTTQPIYSRNDKPLNNPFGAHNLNNNPENRYYVNNHNSNTANLNEQMDFYKWDNNNSSGNSNNLNSFGSSNFNNFPPYEVNNNNNNNNMRFNVSTGININGNNYSENNVNLDDRMVNFGNNTSQIVMGIVSNTVRETTGLNSEKISQLQLWFPQTITSLRSHFAVSHEYVIKKLLFLICPYISFFTQNNKRVLSYENHVSISSNDRDMRTLPTLFSDLYIPLMGFITYVLADGVINGVFSQFNPQILGSTATFSIVLLLTEIILFQLGSYIFAGRVLSTLDLFSTMGYKYTSIVLSEIILLFTGGLKTNLFWGLFIYFSLSSSLLVYMMLKVISAQNFDNHYSMIQQSGLTIVIIISSLAQVPLCWILLPSI